MPDVKQLKPYDVVAARKRLVALELEISAGRGGGLAKALARQLRREIAVAEQGQHPSLAARPSQVPAVKGTARYARSVDEPDAGSEPVALQGAQGPEGVRTVKAEPAVDIDAIVEAKVQERLRQERAALRVASRVKKVGKGKKGKGRAKPKPVTPSEALSV